MDTIPQRGRLIRTIPVRLLDFSWSGCLVEADEAVAPGSSGELQIAMQGHLHRDPIQIIRHTPQRGTRHPYILGGRFVWGRRPDMESVRTHVPSLVTIP